MILHLRTFFFISLFVCLCLPASAAIPDAPAPLSTPSTPAPLPTALAHTIETFEAILKEQDHLTRADRARVLVDLGDAYLTAGDLPRAIIRFRQAQIITPWNQHLLSGLASARSLVRPSTPSSDVSKPAEPLLAPAASSLPARLLSLIGFLESRLSNHLVYTTATVSWILLMVFIIVTMLPRIFPTQLSKIRPIAIPISGLLLVIFASTAAIAALRWRSEQHAAHSAVVMVPSPTYAGPDPLTFAPTPAAIPGQEAMLIREQLGGDGRPWCEIELSPIDPTLPTEAPKGRARHWIPKSALAFLNAEGS